MGQYIRPRRARPRSQVFQYGAGTNLGSIGFLRPAHCFEDDEHVDDELPERDGTAGPHG